MFYRLKIPPGLLIIYMLMTGLIVCGQQAIDDKQFFAEEQPLDVTVSTDINHLLRRKIKDDTMTATLTCTLPDGSVAREEIGISLRGNMRRRICPIPPVKFHFCKSDSSRLHRLKTLKLVNACGKENFKEQWLLKEYIAYKIYNLLTEKSFRVRLLTITYDDINDKKKPFTNYAFLIEDVDEMAKRNTCKELNDVKVMTNYCEKFQMTMVDLFQYMIGNTDWSVPNYHNIKLILPKGDSTARPYAVPYDFDYAGLVNATYAVPAPDLGIEKVVQRVYRGFSRTMTELEDVLKVFNRRKDSIYTLIRDFAALSSQSRNEMIAYLDEFYRTINDPAEVKDKFIDNTRSF